MSWTKRRFKVSYLPRTMFVVCQPPPMFTNVALESADIVLALGCRNEATCSALEAALSEPRQGVRPLSAMLTYDCSEPLEKIQFVGAVFRHFKSYSAYNYVMNRYLQGTRGTPAKPVVTCPLEPRFTWETIVAASKCSRYRATSSAVTLYT
jgi:hypothetical protein